MRIHLIFFLVFTGIYSYLNANNLYFDIGVYSDVIHYKLLGSKTRHSFVGAKSILRINKDSIEGEGIKQYNQICGLKPSIRLGYRIGDKFAFISEYQNFGESIDFFYRVNEYWLIFNRTTDFNITMGPIHYFGLGFVSYPYPRLQFGFTLGDAKLGVKFKAISENVEDHKVSDYLGMGVNMSISLEIPIKKCGILLGGGYFYSIADNSEKHPFSLVMSKVSSLGLFTKIRY